MTLALFKQRFEELAGQFDDVLATKTYFDNQYARGHSVDDSKLLNWCVKVKNLIVSTCGAESQHFEAFQRAEKQKSMQTSHERAELMGAVFRAAHEGYEGGYLNSLRNIIQAEVFSTELEQATELFDAGYATAAAVIAGTVLKTTLRQLCADRGIQPAAMGKMNDDLAKVGCYNRLVQKGHHAGGHPQQCGARPPRTIQAPGRERHDQRDRELHCGSSLARAKQSPALGRALCRQRRYVLTAAPAPPFSVMTCLSKCPLDCQLMIR